MRRKIWARKNLKRKENMAKEQYDALDVDLVDL